MELEKKFLVSVTGVEVVKNLGFIRELYSIIVK